MRAEAGWGHTSASHDNGQPQWWHVTTLPTCHVSRCGLLTHVTILISSRHDHNYVTLWPQSLSTSAPAISPASHQPSPATVDCFYRARNKIVADSGITRGNIAPEADCFIWAVKSPPDSIFWFRVRYLEARSPLGSGNLLHCRGQSRPESWKQQSSARVSQTSSRIFDGLDS